MINTKEVCIIQTAKMECFTKIGIICKNGKRYFRPITKLKKGEGVLQKYEVKIFLKFYVRYLCWSI